MYVSIHATSVSNDYSDNHNSRGKSMWMNEPDFEISLCQPSSSHLGNPAWHFEIKCEAFEDVTRDGLDLTIIRELCLQLTPDDIDKILAQLVANDVVKFLGLTTRV
jgi:hypothetical protein